MQESIQVQFPVCSFMIFVSLVFETKAFYMLHFVASVHLFDLSLSLSLSLSCRCMCMCLTVKYFFLCLNVCHFATGK